MVYYRIENYTSVKQNEKDLYLRLPLGNQTVNEKSLFIECFGSGMNKE